MDENSKKLIQQWRDEIEALGKLHSARSKHLAWYARNAQPVCTFLGILGGTTGTASILSSFLSKDDESISFEWPQVIALVQGAMLVAQSYISAQNYELRSERHNNTGGDAAEFINKVDALLMDSQLDKHDIIKGVEELSHMKTDIEQNAPHL